MKNRTENISVRYRPQHLTKSQKKAIDKYQLPFYYILFMSAPRLHNLSTKPS